MAELIGGSGYDDVQSTAPSSPSIGDTWLDTSTDPPTGKIYADLGSGGQWTTDLLDQPISNAGANLKWGYYYNLSASDLSRTDYMTDTEVLYGIAWNNDGTKLFVTGSYDGKIYQYSLTTAYDISTLSFEQSLDVSGQDSSPQGLAWNSDGTNLYMTGGSGVNIYQYSLTTAYDISTSSFEQSLDVGPQEGNPRGIAWNNDGTQLFITGSYGEEINEYSLTTAYDISTATASQAFDVSGQDTLPHGLTINDDGSKFYVSGAANNNVYTYILSTPFDISTATLSNTLDISNQTKNPHGIVFNGDGSKFYLIEEPDHTVFEFIVGEVVPK